MEYLFSTPDRKQCVSFSWKFPININRGSNHFSIPFYMKFYYCAFSKTETYFYFLPNKFQIYEKLCVLCTEGPVIGGFHNVVYLFNYS